ncbi:sulfurtransferase-like selenium metabolism protein YedF [Desulfuromonas carbonis]|uniref:sulfurtransferase-like selenium metabolism protein YedF n=1 Tax=Desulfuromonas sp. DDH964 TaxID=1823759 RepID=UPI00078EEA9E|nr:sulfurtransferase-like selenium metabolism protein YedF [Desulfuromonas sp. DDH964]AMV73267.1 selenium metabolism protein YedF [Desulfuromonas sp. DDH964]
MKTLDCRAHQCPHPVVETRKAILAAPDEALTVLVGDDTARENVGRMAASLGFAVEVAATEGGFALQLQPGTGPASEVTPAAATGPTVIFIGAETMGSGSDELGRLLLKNFLITLLDLDSAPDAILFVNCGVKLVCQGAEVREALEQLACRGTDIAACGLCLDFYALKEEVAVGRVTNMFDIARTLTGAGRVVRP